MAHAPQKRALIVRRSKLEIYVGILEILVRARNFASQESMDLTQLVHKTDMSQKVLKQHLNFLVRQNLVEKQNLGKEETFYAITERGRTVLKYFREINTALQIIEEAKKIPALLY